MLLFVWVYTVRLLWVASLNWIYLQVVLNVPRLSKCVLATPLFYLNLFDRLLTILSLHFHRSFFNKKVSVRLIGSTGLQAITFCCWNISINTFELSIRDFNAKLLLLLNYFNLQLFICWLCWYLLFYYCFCSHLVCQRLHILWKSGMWLFLLLFFSISLVFLVACSYLLLLNDWHEFNDAGMVRI